MARQVLGMVPHGAEERGREATRQLAALSARESEILGLVAEGLSNAEIGGRVHMAEATIKTYVSRILTKLDCANRVQAAMLVRDVQPYGGETAPRDD